MPNERGHELPSRRRGRADTGTLRGPQSDSFCTATHSDCRQIGCPGTKSEESGLGFNPRLKRQRWKSPLAVRPPSLPHPPPSTTPTSSAHPRSSSVSGRRLCPFSLPPSGPPLLLWWHQSLSRVRLSRLNFVTLAHRQTLSAQPTPSWAQPAHTSLTPLPLPLLTETPCATVTAGLAHGLAEFGTQTIPHPEPFTIGDSDMVDFGTQTIGMSHLELDDPLFCDQFLPPECLDFGTQTLDYPVSVSHSVQTCLHTSETMDQSSQT